VNTNRLLSRPGEIAETGSLYVGALETAVRTAPVLRGEIIGNTFSVRAGRQVGSRCPRVSYCLAARTPRIGTGPARRLAMFKFVAPFAKSFEVFKMLVLIPVIRICPVVNLKVPARSAPKATVSVAVENPPADLLPVRREQKISIGKKSQIFGIVSRAALFPVRAFLRGLQSHGNVRMRIAGISERLQSFLRSTRFPHHCRSLSFRHNRRLCAIEVL